jgi:hypothetical protein
MPMYEKDGALLEASSKQYNLKLKGMGWKRYKEAKPKAEPKKSPKKS